MEYHTKYLHCPNLSQDVVYSLYPDWPLFSLAILLFGRLYLSLLLQVRGSYRRVSILKRCYKDIVSRLLHWFDRG